MLTNFWKYNKIKSESKGEQNMGTNQHVTNKNDEWRVIGENNKKATKIFPTQKEAIEYGRKIAINQKSELVIHGKDGKIRDKDSYGVDPYPPKDKKM